jgi:hypothetical protein
VVEVGFLGTGGDLVGEKGVDGVAGGGVRGVVVAATFGEEHIGGEEVEVGRVRVREDAETGSVDRGGGVKGMERGVGSV